MVPWVRFELTELLLLRESTLPICPPGLRFLLVQELFFESRILVARLHAAQQDILHLRSQRCYEHHHIQHARVYVGFQT